MIALIEMLLHVLILVGDLSPHLHALLDAQDTTCSGSEAFVEAVVDGSRNADIERTSAFLADAYGFIDA